MLTTRSKSKEEDSSPDTIPTLSVFEAFEKWEQGDYVVLDVRGSGDYESVHVEGSIHIEFTEVMANLSLLPRNKEIGVLCYGGGASEYITKLLLEQGFSDVANIEGGIIRWALDVDEALLEQL